MIVESIIMLNNQKRNYNMIQKEKKKMNEINLVSISNAKGVRGIAVLIKSALNNLTVATNIYILCSDISNKDKVKLQRSWKSKLTKSITFIDIDFSRIKSFRTIPTMKHKETYLRLFLGELMPEPLKRCIVVDLDILVTEDISKIYYTNLKGNVVAAVRDVSATIERVLTFRKKYLKEPEKYFNGGMLLVDLDAWRKEKLDKKMQKCAIDDIDLMTATEQDALNICLAGKWLEIDKCWNISQYEKEISNPSIPLTHKGMIHLIGPIKPWMAGYDMEKIQKPWYQVLNQTAYAGIKPKLKINKSIYFFFKTLPKYEHIVGKIKREFKKRILKK